MPPKRRASGDDGGGDDGGAGPALKRLDLGIGKSVRIRELPAPPPRPAPPPYVINESFTRKLSAYRQWQWLERSKQWQDMRAGDWEPEAVLGAGSFGIVGRWRYVGGDEKYPKYMAVKQSGPQDHTEMEWESKLLRKIMAANSEHIVKIYKGFHTDGGSGITNGLFDPIPFDEDGNYDDTRLISRIYLEYCENGDAKGLLARWVKKGGTPSEEWIWRTFLCLLKGHLVLDQGNELPDDPDIVNQRQRWGKPIAHFDLKPGNILVGGKGAGDHRAMEAFKLADFGNGLQCPRDDEVRYKLEYEELRSARWIAQTRWRFTPNYSAPEQYFEDHPNRLIDSRTGIFVVGLVLYGFVTNKFPGVKTTFYHRSLDDPTKQIKVLCKPDLLLDRMHFTYSGRLVTFCNCLAYDPADRPPIARLVKEAQRWVDAFDAKYAEDGVDYHSDMLYDGENSMVIIPGGAFAAFPMADKCRVDYDYNLQHAYAFDKAPSSVDEDVAPPLLFRGKHVGFGHMAITDYPYSSIYETPKATPAAPSSSQTTGAIAGQTAESDSSLTSLEEDFDDGDDGDDNSGSIDSNAAVIISDDDSYESI